MSRNDQRDFSVLAGQLRNVWESGETLPPLSAILRGSGQLAPEELLELCLIDQSHRWRTPDPLRVEDYLALCPMIAQRPELQFELAYGELRTRQQLSGACPAAEIESRFPEFAERLHRQLEVGFWLEQGADSRPPGEAFPRICSMHRSGRFGPYELGEAIAHGGMGVIFRARDVRLNRIVALKMIRADRITHEADRQRFHNETVTIAQLEHPHIIPIYDVGEEAGVHYFTMKLLKGGDLQQQCRRYLDDPHAAAQIMAHVADAVHYAHRHGVLHRDVKPSNVLLDEAGKPYVTDFGLARRLDDRNHLTATGDLLGTPAYLAPEQLTPGQGSLTIAADVYGLGAVLYVLLTGKPPFDDEHLLTMLESMRHREPAPPRQLNPRIDRDLEQICLKALAKRPSDRYFGAQAFAEDLQRYLAGEGIRARPAPWWRRWWRRWRRRHSGLAAVNGVALIVAAFLLLLLGFQSARLQAMRQALDGSLQAARAEQADAEADRSEAARLRRSAKQLRAQAEEARSEAVAQCRLAHRAAYATAIRNIEHAWRSGNTATFWRLLDEQVPQGDQADVRGFEWFVLNRYCDRAEPSQIAWHGYERRASSIAFHPHRERWARGGRESHVAVWTLRDAEGEIDLRRTGRETKSDRALAFSPDGRILVAAAADGLHLWNWQTTDPATRLSHNGEPRDLVAISPDGKYVAAAGEQPRLIEVWGRTPAGYRHLWKTDAQHCDHLAFSPRGNLLLAADWAGDEIAVYAPAAGQVEQRLAACQMRACEFSPNGRQLACTAKNDIVVWDWDAAQPLLRLEAHLSTVMHVAYSPDGLQLASCGRDGRVIVWDARTGERLRIMMGHRSFPLQVAFVGNDRLLSLSEDGGILVWHVELGTQLCCLRPVLANPCFRFAVSPDQRLLAGRLADNHVQLLDLSRD